MILIYFQNKQIHNSFLGFGAVTTVNDTLHIDGTDTTTNAADVRWKYIADQVLERGVDGNYLHNADYYAIYDPDPTDHDLLMAIAEILEAELA